MLNHTTGAPADPLAHIATFNPAPAPTPALHNMPAVQSLMPSAPSTPSSTKAAHPQPFILSKASPPVPAKLVAKVQALQFVDMRELLPDNMALLERSSVLPQGTAPPSNSSPKQRDIPSLTTWVCAFATYIAVLYSRGQARPYKKQAGLYVQHCPGSRTLRGRWLENVRLYFPLPSRGGPNTGLVRAKPIADAGILFLQQSLQSRAAMHPLPRT